MLAVQNMYVLNAGRIMSINRQSIAQGVFAAIAIISSHMAPNTVFAVILPMNLGAKNTVHICVQSAGTVWKTPFEMHWVANEIGNREPFVAPCSHFSKRSIYL